MSTPTLKSSDSSPILGAALWESRRELLPSLRTDLLSGLLIALLSLPFALALAIAAGVPAVHGLYTMIAAGTVVALLGGSRFQITGPTAAFAVILAPLTQELGISGLLAAGFLGGILLVTFGLLGLGSWVERIPTSVSVGFTTGIAVVIAKLQLLTLGSLEELDWINAAAAFVILITLPRFKLLRAVPPAFVALVASVILPASKLIEIPPGMPEPRWLEGLDGSALPRLMIPALSIAILASLESLLAAKVSDLDTGLKHSSRSELIALGIGNCIAPIFGGIPAAGAIARTTANWRLGARTPLSGVFHGLWALGFLWVLAPWVSKVPLAGLSGILLWVAWKMADPARFWRFLKTETRAHQLALITAFGLTIAANMIVGVVGALLVLGVFKNGWLDWD